MFNLPRYLVTPDLISFDPNKQYSLIGQTGESSTLIRQLDSTEAEALLTSMSKISQFVEIEWYTLETAENLQDYSRASGSTFKIENLIANAYPDQNLEILNAARLCRNYVTSWRIAIDGLERHIYKTFGRDSDIGKEWGSLKKSLFNNNFEYRFIYALRNVGEHITRVIDRMSVAGDVTIPVFSKRKLIDTKEFKKAHFDNDWGTFNDTFPVTPILLKSLELLTEANEFCLKKHSQLVTAHIDNIEKIVGDRTFERIYIGERLPERSEYPGISSDKIELIPVKSCRRIKSWSNN